MSVSEQRIPEGFVQSEVGLIPEDWDVKTIGESCDVLTGFPFPSNKYCDSGIRLLRGSNVKRGETDWSPEITQYWPEITPNIKEYELRVGDIVVSMDGSLVGKSYAQLSKEDLPAVLLQRVARIRSESIEVNYLKEWVCSKFFSNHCDSVKTVTAIPHISPLDIRSFRLLVPSEEEEQTAIANALSDVDALLTELEKLIAKKQAIKTATMQQLLTGKTRLPQFATYTEGEKQGQCKGTKPSELGEIPEDWDVVSLGEVFNFKNGLNKEKEFFGYGTPIVNYMDVYNSSGITAKKVNGLVNVTPLEKKNYSAKKGDVFFTRTSETTDEIGLASVLLDSIKDAVFSGFVLRARQTKQLLENGYMKYCFREAAVRKQIQSTASYTTRALTNGQLLSNVMMLVPTQQEQTAIATILSDMDNEIQTLEQRLAKTRQIKQGMMQELLTGRTRLPFEKEK